MAIGVFPYRKTQVVFNDYLPSATQQWIAIQRKASEMARSSDASTTNVVFIPGIGWQLKSYHLSPGDALWLSAAQSGCLSPGTGAATLAPNHTEFDGFNQVPLLGLSYSPEVQSSGSPYFIKGVGASGDFASNSLTDDQSAFPSPNPSEDYTPMDRVYLGSPGYVEPWDCLLFNVYLPSGGIGSRSTITTFMFNGPASFGLFAEEDQAQAGSGQYALKLRGDGFAYLYELNLSGVWINVYSFQWNDNPNPVPLSVISITVFNDVWMNVDGSWGGSKMSFLCTTRAQGFPLIETLVQVAEISIKARGRLYPTFVVPRLKKQNLTVCPIRIDVSQDVVAACQVSKHVFYPNGTLIDDFVSFGQPITDDVPLILWWKGVLPSGTSWQAQVADQDGTTLSPVSGAQVYTTDRGQVSYQTFTPTKGMRYAQATITFTSSADFFRSPILTEWEMYRSATFTSDNPVALVTAPYTASPPPSMRQTQINSVQISPQQSDPGSENATVVLEDYVGALSFLESRNMNPIAIQTQYDESGVWTNLFVGYVLEAHGMRRRSNSDRTYPNQYFTEWTCHCVGEWARLAEQTMPNFRQFLDPITNKGYKVTDAIRELMESVYPSSMVYVPDQDIQIFGEDASSYVAQPGARQSEYIAMFASDFLGGYVLFDESAGPNGTFRLLPQKTAPYTNLVVFEIDHPTKLAGDGKLRLPSWSASYGTSLVNGATIKHTFISARDRLGIHRERAEGNAVIVFGGAIGADAGVSGAGSAGLITQVALNVGSANFFNLNPSDPGYPDGSSPEYFGRVIPIRVIDYKLPSQEAVDWKCRRVFDKACFSRFYLTFTAPMELVFDVTDPIQTSPRRLRFYDPVQVRNYDGSLSQFLVVSCMPTYVKDHVQMAQYLLVTQSNIDSIGVISPLPSNLRSFLKGLGRALGTPNLIHSSDSGTYNKLGHHLNSEMMGLPEPTADPIQDLDNTSPTYGKFFFLTGYSALGGPDVMRSY